MKIISLEMKYFMVYEYQKIDFTNFDNKNIFLITGPTGSGKSTIFDAIVFALYGKSSTEDRSKLSNDELITASGDFDKKDAYVCLIFESNDKRYRIKRYPSYRRINRNGNMVTESQRIEFQMEDSKGRYIPYPEIKLKEIDEKISEVVGLTYDQFTKVIMLPQNEFENFLKSKSIQKAEILKSIFPIDIYTRFEEEIHIYKSELEKELLNIKDKMDIYSERLDAVDKDKGIDELFYILESLKNEVDKIDFRIKDEEKKEKEKNNDLKNYIQKNKRIKKFQENKKKLKEKNNDLIEAEDILKNVKKINDSQEIINSENLYLKDKKDLSNEKNNREKLSKNYDKKNEELNILKEKIDRKYNMENINLDLLLEEYNDKLNNLEKEIIKCKFNLEKIENEIIKQKQLDEKSKKIGQYQKELEELEKIIKKESEEFSILEKEYENSGLLKYKEKLEEGMPCPLCGSTKHPMPVEGVLISKKEVDKKKNNLDKYNSRLILLQSNIKNIDEILEVEKYEEEGIEKLLAEEKEIKKKISNLKEEKDDLNKEIEYLKNENKEWKELKDDILQIGAKLDQTKNLVKRYEENLVKSKNVFENLLFEKFDDITIYRKLVDNRSKYLLREKWAKEVIDEILVLKALIDDNKELEDVKIIDTFDLENEIKKISEEKKLLNDKKTSFSIKISNYKEVIEELKKNEKEYKIKEEVFETVDYLDKLISGSMSKDSGINNAKMTLETFVLSNYFERILELANIRLEKISNGRYSMVRKIETSGNSKEGLDIEIFDSAQGVNRDQATLSGGEIFIVSLSLALGLADEVSSNSGILEIQNLFIDEGFGSLDQETLESSMEVLTDISGEGKLIGIISHVESLKENIPNKIIINKDKMGKSKIEMELI